MTLHLQQHAYFTPEAKTALTRFIGCRGVQLWFDTIRCGIDATASRYGYGEMRITALRPGATHHDDVLFGTFQYPAYITPSPRDEHPISVEVADLPYPEYQRRGTQTSAYLTDGQPLAGIYEVRETSVHYDESINNRAQLVRRYGEWAREEVLPEDFPGVRVSFDVQRYLVLAFAEEKLIIEIMDQPHAYQLHLDRGPLWQSIKTEIDDDTGLPRYAIARVDPSVDP